MVAGDDVLIITTKKHVDLVVASIKAIIGPEQD